MAKCVLLTLALVLNVGSAVAAGCSLFNLPLSAKVTDRSADGKGWREQGVLDVTVVQAAGQFRAALAQSGWNFLHAVPIVGANTRTLYAWRRGNQTLTLMLWRIDVGTTGFSWGVARDGK